jgi:EAL domain-containing protein (putative c-di-GMP-specific phosphodiesterase class I)
MPADFIELAERTELVRSMTMEVVRQAVRQCALWRGLGMTLPVAVNLSPRILLDVALPTDIAQALEEEGLPPEMLEMEVTESCLISDPDRSAEVLGRINDTGIRISIDDFGTGYSSLALLKRLPVNSIKIDRSFVDNLASDPNDMVIVESTIKLAQGLGLEVIAEGVEDEQTLELLASYGCGQVQGFHICRPLPALGLMSWMKTHVPRAIAGAGTA